MGKIVPDSYFNEVYDKTVKSVSRFVVSKCGNILDVEDILQNIYARFYQRISRKGYDDIENPEAFLINIAKFECRTYFGKKAKNNISDSFSDFTEERMVEIEAQMSSKQKGLEEVLCNELLARQIFEDIANADDVTGQIFYLHYVCDLKLDEVAKRLDMNLSTVKNKLYRTLEKQRIKFDL